MIRYTFAQRITSSCNDLSAVVKKATDPRAAMPAHAFNPLRLSCAVYKLGRASAYLLQYVHTFAVIL